MPVSTSLIPLSSLLSRLSWPAGVDASGMAAWSEHARIEAGMRHTAAWVKSNGRTVEAELSVSVGNEAPEVVNLAWNVLASGSADFVGARDRHGSLIAEKALEKFSSHVRGLPKPIFLPSPSRSFRR